MRPPVIPPAPYPGLCAARPAGLLAATLVVALAGVTQPAAAQNMSIYRCDGKPVIYTSDPRLVAARRCDLLERPSQEGSLPAVAPAARAAKAGVSASALVEPQVSRIAAMRPPAIPQALQRERDADRVRILQDELTRERDKLTQLSEQLRAAGSGSGQATAATRLSAAIQRTESDIASLTRELSSATRP